MPVASGRMNDWERAICARVKTVRESIRWSQPAFAEQLGITRDRLASIEYGRTPLRYDVAWRLRQAFGISLRWLEQGMPLADKPESDYLPIPTGTGMPPDALLSTVAQKFGDSLDETLVPIGPERKSAPPAPRPPSSSKQTYAGKITSDSDLLQAIEAIARGREGVSGSTDAVHRMLHEDFLKGQVEDWIASIPLGRVAEFSDELMRSGFRFIQSIPPEPPEVVRRRYDEIMWERIRRANARRILVAKDYHTKVLTSVTPSRKRWGMTEMQLLLQRLKRALEGMKKGDLARSLKVPLPRISEWLSGRVMPSGETALRLLNWVEHQERKPKESPASASTPTRQKTRVRKHSYESKPSPKKQ